MYVYILHSDVHFDLYYTIRLYTSQCFENVFDRIYISDVARVSATRGGP